MEAAAILRSFPGAFKTTQCTHSSLEKHYVAPISGAALRTVSCSRISFVGQSLISARRKGSFMPYIKASESTAALTSDTNALDKTSQAPSEKKSVQKSNFPNGFEALIYDVCDQTSVAELKLKVGDFEMHLKRDIVTAQAPTVVPAVASPTTAPPIPSKPMGESSPSVQPAAPQKPSSATTNPFASASTIKASKLAALDASGANGYVIISSPTVGTFRSGRTLKGKRQPPSCKEGDIIKEGQVIGFVSLLGSELPVKSDVAGEVLKILFRDGDGIGYGDPLVAVLPSFHGIK